MEKLCDDLSSEILIRLPSKNIAQLRCVCKRWNTLLCEASFIKSHLLRSINSNDKDEITLVFHWGRGYRFPFKAYSSASPNIELTNFIKFPPDNFPLEKRSNKILNTVIGSANGLICFSIGYYDDIYVWNPSLSAFLTVPPYAIPVPPYCPYADYYFWFCFDPKNFDYKIVKLIKVQHKRSVEWLQGEVYSMRSGCWKLITQGFPSRVSNFYNDEDINVYADGHDGHIHWLCSYDDSSKIHTIVAFDLAAESFSEISLPDPMNTVDRHNRPTWVDLRVFGGKLCVISSPRSGVGNCEVWVMDQYGSWVKNGFSDFDDIYPYGFMNRNNFIPYVESLVWVTPPTC